MPPPACHCSTTCMSRPPPYPSHCHSSRLTPSPRVTTSMSLLNNPQVTSLPIIPSHSFPPVTSRMSLLNNPHVIPKPLTPSTPLCHSSSPLSPPACHCSTIHMLPLPPTPPTVTHSLRVTTRMLLLNNPYVTPPPLNPPLSLIIPSHYFPPCYHSQVTAQQPAGHPSLPQHLSVTHHPTLASSSLSPPACHCSITRISPLPPLPLPLSLIPLSLLPPVTPRACHCSTTRMSLLNPASLFILR